VRSQAIRIEIGELMPDGYRINEIATELGVTPSWVSARLDELRSEIVLAAGGFLPLSDTEYAALKDSLAEHGQQVPIIVGSSGLLDGKHRITALRELGITEILVQFVTDADPETERRISRTVNAARRMLNRAQKEALVRSELEHNWARSSRQIALDCGCSIGFVETIREAVRTEREPAVDELVLDDEPLLSVTDNGAEKAAPRSVGEAVRAATIPREEEMRVDARGVRRPAYPKNAEMRKRRSGPNRPHGYAECCHGVRHAIFRTGPGKTWRLEQVDDG
jgi:DNA-binding Lrp family transcriptional regulator